MATHAQTTDTTPRVTQSDMTPTRTNRPDVGKNNLMWVKQKKDKVLEFSQQYHASHTQ